MSSQPRNRSEQRAARELSRERGIGDQQALDLIRHGDDEGQPTGFRDDMLVCYRCNREYRAWPSDHEHRSDEDVLRCFSCRTPFALVSRMTTQAMTPAPTLAFLKSRAESNGNRPGLGKERLHCQRCDQPYSADWRAYRHYEDDDLLTCHALCQGPLDHLVVDTTYTELSDAITVGDLRDRAESATVLPNA